MISGALLLPNASNQTPLEFYKKRASRLLSPLVFWTLAYLFFLEYTEKSFGLTDAVKSIIKGSPYYHLWYLYMLVGLYLVTPFLRQLVAGIRPDLYHLLLAVSFTIAAIESVFGGTSATFLPGFLPFVGYFLAGHYLYQYPCKIKSRILILAPIACGILISIGTGMLLPDLGPKSWGIMYSYLNPLVIIMSLGVFLLFTRQEISGLGSHPLFHRLATITLGIYIIHPLWLWLLAKFGINGFLINPFIGIPTTTLLAFTLSAVSAALLTNIPIIRQTV